MKLLASVFLYHAREILNIQHSLGGLLCCQSGVSSCSPWREQLYKREWWRKLCGASHTESSCRVITSSPLCSSFCLCVWKNLCSGVYLLERHSQLWPRHRHRRAHSQLHHYKKIHFSDFLCCCSKGACTQAEFWLKENLCSQMWQGSEPWQG